MRSGRGPGYERRGGEVHAMRYDRRVRRPVLRELRRHIACGSPSRHPRPGAVARASVRRLRWRDIRRRLLRRMWKPARRARTRPGGSRRDRADHRPRPRTPSQRGRRRGGNRRLRLGRSASWPSPCATESPPQSAADTAAKSASTAGVDAMLKRSPRRAKPQSAVLAGLTDAAKAAAVAGADTSDLTIAPSCTYAAVTVVPTLDGRCRDRRRQRRGQQGVLDSRTPRRSAMPHGRRLRCAGIDLRRRRPPIRKRYRPARTR